MAVRGLYVVRFAALSVSTIKTLIQVKAGANAGLELVRAVLSQNGSTTSTEQDVQILRKSAAATVTSFTPLLLNPNDSAAQAAGGTSATGYNASAEGTDGDILVDDTWNILTSWNWCWIPEERPTVAPGGIIGLKLPTAPASALTIKASLYFRELV